ncbi:MAG: ATP-binding protein [Steroidobacteraceae bacterium]|nr:ATP-binding protein [Steroidobacteraceae bacterium]
MTLATIFGGLQVLLAERFGTLITRMSLEGQTEDIFDGFRFDAAGRLTAVALEDVEAYGYDAFFANLKYRVLDASGRVVATSDGTRESLLPAVPIAQQDGYFSRVEIPQGNFYVGAWQRRFDGGEFTLQLARSDRFEELAQAAIAPAVIETALLLGVLAAVVFSLFAVRAVRSVLGPIREATRSAASVGRDNLAARIPSAQMPAEIRPLLDAFNGVLGRLQTAFEQQERFLANAAHELKTPLALMRSSLESESAVDRAPLLREIDAMGRRVQQLLQLAETADAGNLRPQRIDMTGALARSAEYLRWKADRCGVAVRYEHPAQPVMVDADEGALFVLTKNLLENAIEFSPEGGVVSLTLDLDGYRVDDEGPGVPPEQRQLVFERFWRQPGQTRAGAGLGLALGAEICRAHGWTLSCDGAPSGGARFEVRWRRDPAPVRV